MGGGGGCGREKTWKEDGRVLASGLAISDRQKKSTDKALGPADEERKR